MEGTQTEGNKRKERILIRNLREKKIITLADSKCQPGKGSRWREAHAHTDTQTQVGGEGEKHPEGDRWGRGDGDTITAPSRRKEHNLSDTKRQNIAW